MKQIIYCPHCGKEAMEFTAWTIGEVLNYLGEIHRLSSNVSGLLVCHITCPHCGKTAKNYTGWRIDDIIHEIFGIQRAPYWEKQHDKITKILQKYKQEGRGAFADKDIKTLKKVYKKLADILPCDGMFYLMIEGLNELLEEEDNNGTHLAEI